MGIVLLALVLVGASIDTYNHYHEKKDVSNVQLEATATEKQNSDQIIELNQAVTPEESTESQSK